MILLICFLGFAMFPGSIILIGLVSYLFPTSEKEKRIGKEIVEHYSGIEIVKDANTRRKKSIQESGFKNRSEVWHAYRIGKITREELEYWKSRF